VAIAVEKVTTDALVPKPPKRKKRKNTLRSLVITTGSRRRRKRYLGALFVARKMIIKPRTAHTNHSQREPRLDQH
jgi:hypothetical protein